MAALLGRPQTRDELAAATGLAVHRVLAEITRLRSAGHLISYQPDGQFQHVCEGAARCIAIEVLRIFGDVLTAESEARLRAFVGRPR